MNSKIPESWAIAKLENVCSLITDGTHQTPEYAAEGITFLSSKNVTSKTIDWNNVKYIPKKLHLELSKRVQPRLNDILLAKNGTTGVAAIVDRDEVFDIYVSLALLRVQTGMNPEYLLRFLNSPLAKKQFNKRLKGVGVPNLHLKEIRQVTVGIPPEPEQRRIVSKIDCAISKIESIEKAANDAETLLKKYRESLLAKAFRGELVPQDPSDEPASKLLERIRIERAEVDEEKSGKKSKKIKELPPIGDEEIPFEIPQSWVWVRLGEMCSVAEYGSSAKTNDDANGVPVLRMGNIQNGELDYTNLKYLPQDHEEFPRLFLEDGDLLFNRTNSPELVGKCAVFDTAATPCSFASYLIRLRFFKSSVLPRWVSEFINSRNGRKWVTNVMVQQVGQANVNGTKLQECLIPVPPWNEQLRAMREIEARSLQAGNVIKSFKTVIETSKQLQNSILQSAFSGGLVQQLESDGTGHDLLSSLPPNSMPSKGSRAAKKSSNKKRSQV